MKALFAIVRVSLRQLLGRRRLIVLGLLSALPAVVVWFATANSSRRGALDTYHESGLILLFLIVMPIASIVLAAAALGDERRDGTLSFLLVRPLPRAGITAAKLSAAFLAAGGLSVFSGILASAAVSARTSDWSTLVPTIVSLAISSWCYVAVFLIVGYLTSRAVLLGLVYLFIWESGIAFAASSLANVSLFRIGLTAYAAMRPETRALLSDPLGSLAPGTGGAVAKAMALAAAAIIAGATLLRRRDTT
jgi:ABC-2 type transport system permease protein